MFAGKYWAGAGAASRPPWEGEIQLRALEKILSGELCLLQLQMRSSPASRRFPLGSTLVCQVMCGEGAGYKLASFKCQRPQDSESTKGDADFIFLHCCSAQTVLGVFVAL